MSGDCQAQLAELRGELAAAAELLGWVVADNRYRMERAAEDLRGSAAGTLASRILIETATPR